MLKYVGTKNSRIQVISNTPINCRGLQSIAVPQELETLSNEELILNYRVRHQQVVLARGASTANKMKVALVGNHQMACGIATYNAHLFAALAPHVKDFHLFVEEHNNLTGPLTQLGNLTLTKDQVSMCWKRGEPLNDLAQQIKNYDPDVVLISHEWGLFPNARYWLSLLTQLSEYRTIVILHSVFPSHMDKTICEAAISEIVVHQVEAKNALQTDKHVQSPITVIPHGCYAAINTAKLWNLYQSPHTFIQSGFGHRYKAFGSSIQAVSLLKKKYPDIFLTILFSESPYNKVGHQTYYDELMALIHQLGVQNQVAIVRGFLSDEVIDAYLRTNQAAVFPYASEPGHVVMGSSGAARLAMSKGIATITSSIPHFIDLPTIKADTAEQIAQALDHLFADPVAQQTQIDRQLKFIKENSWEVIAQRYLDLFEGAN